MKTEKHIISGRDNQPLGHCEANSYNHRGTWTCCLACHNAIEILLHFVDDEIVIANMNQSILQRLGYKVTTRTDSQEALEKFSSDPEQFDLLITDQTMLNLTGDELAGDPQAISKTG